MIEQHNHATRDIKPSGECPACDHYRQTNTIENEIRPPDIYFDAVTEACADALLAAAAAKIYPKSDAHDVVDAAIEAIKVVVERTLREGAKAK